MSGPIETVIQNLGSGAALARALGVSQMTVSNWRRAELVPLERCVAIEQLPASDVTCEQLRPDVRWQRDAQGQVTGYTIAVEPDHPARAA